MPKAIWLAFAGLLAAIAVDLDAWGKYPTEDGNKARFDWKTALSRYAYGFITGLVTGITTMGSE